MPTVLIRYQLRPDQVEENLRLLDDTVRSPSHVSHSTGLVKSQNRARLDATALTTHDTDDQPSAPPTMSTAA